MKKCGEKMAIVCVHIFDETAQEYVEITDDDGGTYICLTCIAQTPTTSEELHRMQFKPVCSHCLEHMLPTRRIRYEN